MVRMAHPVCIGHISVQIYLKYVLSRILQGTPPIHQYLDETNKRVIYTSTLGAKKSIELDGEIMSLFGVTKSEPPEKDGQDGQTKARERIRGDPLYLNGDAK